MKTSIHIASFETISEEEMYTIVDLINRVYLESEKDFWPHNGDYERVNLNQIKEFIQKKELIIAQQNNVIVGCVHVYKLNETTGGFSMLVSDPNKRGNKIGKQLMMAIEDWMKNQNVNLIQLEILKPSEIIHPEKEFIEAWYKRIGYKLISEKPYGELYPHNNHLLKIPCTFFIYHKRIKE